MGPRIGTHGVANGGIAKSFLFAHSFAHSHAYYSAVVEMDSGLLTLFLPEEMQLLY
jgi:hypothetical protein